MPAVKCGDRGFTTLAGAPCQQNSHHGGPCLWHGKTPDERRTLAMRGHLTQRMQKALKDEDCTFTFENEDAVIAFAEDMARKALTKDIDQHRIKTGLEAAKVALSGFAAKTTARMVKALESLEHGGAAMVLLTQMTERLGTGTRRMIPGRVVKSDEESAA